MEWLAENMDKWFHILISIMLTAWLIFLPKKTSYKWIGYGICILFALGKEFFWDLWLGKGNFEWLDIGYTMIFPLLGIIVSLLINKK